MDYMGKRKLLFVGVGFHSYDNLIIKELEKTCSVSYINSCSFQQRHKIMYNVLVHFNLIKIWNKLCADSILEHISNIKETSFDVLFVIRGEYLNKDILDLLVEKYRIPKKILYLWDSYDNHRNLEEIIGIFDFVYSFDSNDCRNNGFNLRPLFYFDEKKPAVNSYDTRLFDLSFVGGDHTNRYEFISSFKQLCIKYHLEYKFYLLIGMVSYFIYQFLPFLSRYKKSDNDILAASSINYKDYIDILDNSKAVIDMPYSNQCGLTMRTIETLSKGIKIITTNASISEYEDIPKELYLVLNDETDEETIIGFLQREINDSCLPDRYSCREALKEMLDF